MRRRMFSLALASTLLLPPSHGTARPTGEDGSALIAISRALLELRVEEAEREMAPLLRDHPEDADVLEVAARISFHRGDYPQALSRIDASLAARSALGRDPRVAQRALIAETARATAAFLEARSTDGRFIVRYAPGTDSLLVPYALEAMKGADDALARHLGYRMPGPIRLEVYPSASSLADVSTLTVEAIERTGTIALCKWDRLMITSPRALVRGYPWLDTVAHEYAHLVLARASRDRAPVWFQEGVAKFLERTWRGAPPAPNLDPSAEALLRRALLADELIPFERLHPSIALLPTQEDAALAFAQVATFFADYRERHGAGAIIGSVRRIALGEDARDALAAESGQRFDALEGQWRQRLRGLPGPTTPPPRMLERRLQRADAPAEEWSEIEEERSRHHIRLGDLLWARRRPAAAAIEYAKALELAPDHPIVASRLARAALAGGDAEAALGASERVLTRHPQHAPALALNAAARWGLGDSEGAARVATEAIRLNPFDPEPHCVLSGASGDAAERRDERRRCQRLGGHPFAPRAP